MTDADAVAVARRFYDALRRRDVTALIDTLDPRFEGRTTAGLPLDLGGTYRGADTMLAEVWGRVHEAFDLVPEVERFLATGEGVVVLGRYTGTARATGLPLDAAFAHVIAVARGKITRLVQVTDSHRWRAALEGAGPEPEGDEVGEVVTAVFDAVRSRDLDGLLAVCSEDVVVRDAPSLPYGGEHHGHAGVIEHGIGYVRTWSPFQTDVDRSPEESVWTSGRHGFARWTLRLTNGDGGRAVFPAVSVFEIEAGEVVALQMFHADTAALIAFLETASPAEGSTSAGGSLAD